MLNLPRIAAKFANVRVAAKLADGSTATVAGVEVAIVPPGTAPTAATTWVSANWVAPVAQVLLIGPLCTPTGAPPYSLTIPAIGGDLWGRVIDNPERDAALLDHIELV